MVWFQPPKRTRLAGLLVFKLTSQIRVFVQAVGTRPFSLTKRQQSQHVLLLPILSSCHDQIESGTVAMLFHNPVQIGQPGSTW